LRKERKGKKEEERKNGGERYRQKKGHCFGRQGKEMRGQDVDLTRKRRRVQYVQ
jgi:hypothetical protein